MTKIVQKESKVLREKAKAVPLDEIKSRKFQTLIKEMKKVLIREKDGVALAAPQIGESWRIFVISKNLPAFEEKEPGKENPKIKPLPDDLVFINPEIIKISKDKESIPEGCLSCRWLYGEVNRSNKATVKAYNEKGECFSLGASGILAQAFQHEIDHLNGILFIDKAKNLIEIKPEKK